MRVNDVGYVLVDTFGDFLSEFRANPYTADEITLTEASLGGVAVRQVPIRLLPEAIAGEQLGQVVMDAIVSMNLINVESYGDLSWVINADEQIGATIKDALRSLRMKVD